VDLVIPEAEAVPASISAAFLIRHFHPGADVGKLAIQLIDPETQLRIDVFTAVGATWNRAYRPGVGSARLVAPEDLACRALLSVLPATLGDPALEKHWSSLQSLLRLNLSDVVLAAWSDHRRASHQEFWDRVRAVHRALEARPCLLTTENYSIDAQVLCSKCFRSADFPLARAEEVIAILGHC